MRFVKTRTGTGLEQLQPGQWSSDGITFYISDGVLTYIAMLQHIQPTKSEYVVCEKVVC